MWGAQEKSGGAHQKIFRRRFAPALCPLTCKLLPTPLASAWYGLTLTKAAYRKRIDSVMDRARRHGYCPLDLPVFDELCKIVW